MDLNVLVDEMSEEERDVFLHTSATQYFHYIEQDDMYQIILEKIEKDVSLNEEEWKYILTKMYLVGCRALTEEEKMDLLTWFVNIVSKVGMKISREDRPLYVECFKMAEYVWGIKKEKEMNLDFFKGIDFVIDSGEESELDILLKQCQENSIFRDNKDAYAEAYQNSTYGKMDAKEKMFIHSCHMAYDREKELIKNYS